MSQTLRPSEVIVIDSASTDGTPELAGRQGCRVIQIPRSQFRHGGTRQQAVQLAKDADIVVFLSQDSILAGPSALRKLIAAFDDPAVAAAYGRQLPRKDANPIEAHARLFNYPPISYVRSLGCVPQHGFKTIFFSNSFGAYRKSALNQVGGFPKESNFGEDTIVAAQLVGSGWRIAYVADAEAYHSHALSMMEEFQRYFRIGQLHESERWMSEEFGRASREARRFVTSEIRYLSTRAPWRIPEALLRTGSKFLAYNLGRSSAPPSLFDVRETDNAAMRNSAVASNSGSVPGAGIQTDRGNPPNERVA
jgi:rhamnosyltransferase